jgi:heterodisulfide reductase subunit A
VAFCCNWCSYAGADFAGVSRMQYPPNVRIIRTMCSGRVAEKFVLRAFEMGAAAVLVSGCHIGDCHYIDANHHTKRRVEKLWNLLEKNGIDKNRLQLAWVSAAEGEKFARKIKEMDKIVKSVSKQEIEKTVKWLKERRANKAEKEKKKADEKIERKRK